MRRCMMGIAVFALCAVPAAELRADEDTPKAAATRKLLKTKIDVDFADTRLADVRDELQDKVKGLKIFLDTKAGVSLNSKVTYSAKNKSVEEILDEMFKKSGLGYYVVSRKGNAYDGLVWIRPGKERGYEAGKEPKP